MDYYWHDCSDPELHLDRATDAVFASLERPSRRWSPHNKVYVRRSIRRRLELAAAGGLKPLAHVKPVGDGQADLFEIRWTDINVVEAGEDGELRFKVVGVRLYHAEPLAISVAAVALHAHEKDYYPDDPKRTHDAQDEQIAIAEGIFRDGWATRWGLPLP
ncbi:hypothetical protein ACFWFR_00775 [Oerskovia sp. NPDC060287]|uniref:hypothetical protein n=1 Tax=Oerskovia sp. NPDC060287 TaxID=3347095 RepID=UPI00364694BF